MDYLALLEHSFAVEKATSGCPPESRFEYLADGIFNFTTYDGAMGDLFGRKAVEVCAAINNRKTFEYIKEEDDAENYKWFLLMCNMPFFANKLEWGTSIRGAWWAVYPGKRVGFQSCMLWVGDEQLADDLTFSDIEWREFIEAVIKFANTEPRRKHEH